MMVPAMRVLHRAAMLPMLPMLMALTLSGCSTAYQAGGVNPLGARFASGYHEEAGPGGLIKVAYKGSDLMGMYQVETFAMYRCAEIAQRERAPYFGLYNSLPNALAGKRGSAIQPTPLLGNPYAEVYISLHQAAAPSLFSTSEVLARLGPEVRAGAK